MNRKTGVIMSYIAMVFELASALILAPLIIRSLGQTEYGVYKLSASIASYLLLLDLGVGNSVIRYIAKYRAEGNEKEASKFLGVVTKFYVLIAIITATIGAVLVYIFPAVFAKGLNSDEIALGQKLLFITIINAVVTLGTAGFVNTVVAYEKFFISKGATICQLCLRIIITVVALKLGYGSLAIVIIQTVLTIIFRVLLALYVLLVINLRPNFHKTESGYIKEVFAYSFLILLQMIATQINSYADNLLLGSLVSGSAAIIGVYNVGAQIVYYFQCVGTGITGVLMPGVVKLVETKPEAIILQKEMIRIGRLILLFLSPIWIGFLIYGRLFISLWAGAEFVDGFYVAILLMSAQMIILTESIGTQILWSMDKQKELAIAKFLVVTINVLLTAELIRWNPLIGAVTGTFIALIAGDVVIPNIIYRNKIGINIRQYYVGLVKGIGLSVLITGIFAYAFSWIQLSGWIGFIVDIILLLIVYAVCIFLFGATAYEKSLIVSILRKLKSIKSSLNSKGSCQ